MPERAQFTKTDARRIGEQIGIDWNSAPFDVDQLRRGMEVELEHGLHDVLTNVTDDDPIVSAKIEAVLAGVAIVFLPLVAVLAFLVPFHALIAALGIVVAAASATQIQLWFRSQAKRGHFRNRMISSRIATFAETISSITWAVTAALAASGNWHAVTAGVIAVATLIGARLR